jgi:hypothetical protein
MNVNRPLLAGLAGAAATVVVLGVTGNLTSCTPIDRTLNPDARHYWQSEEKYVEETIWWCTERYVTLESGSERNADRCVESSLRGAVERGYLQEAWTR